MLLVLADALGIILTLSPMHSKNRKLDQTEKKHFGRQARITAARQTAVFFLLWHLGYRDCAYAVYSCICITAAFMLAGGVKLHIQFYMEK